MNRLYKFLGKNLTNSNDWGIRVFGNFFMSSIVTSISFPDSSTYLPKDKSFRGALHRFVSKRFSPARELFPFPKQEYLVPGAYSLSGAIG